MCDKPPAPRFASAAPRSGAVSWLLGRWRFAHCVGFAESEGTPPASSLTLVAAPQVWWASWRGFGRRGLHRATSWNSSQISKRPGAKHQRRRSHEIAPLRGAVPKARGACPRNLQNRHNEQNANRPPDAKSAPLLRRSRNTGGPRTSDSEGRGGRRKAHPRGLSTCLASLSAVSVSPSARMISTAERTTGKARSSETRARSWRQSQTRRLGMRM